MRAALTLLPELRRYDPLLGFMVSDAVASNGGDGSYVDATLTLPERSTGVFAAEQTRR